MLIPITSLYEPTESDVEPLELVPCPTLAVLTWYNTI